MKRILEIGHGGVLIGATYAHFRNQLPKNVEYFGVDYPRNVMQEFHDDRRLDDLNLSTFANGQKYFNKRMADLNTEFERNPDPRIHLIESDIRKVVLPSHFDEVHLHFVLSDPSVYLLEDLPMEMLSIAKCLLKGRGKIIITGAEQQSLLSPTPIGFAMIDAVDRAGFSEINSRRIFSEVVDLISELMKLRSQHCRCFFMEAVNPDYQN